MALHVPLHTTDTTIITPKRKISALQSLFFVIHSYNLS